MVCPLPKVNFCAGVQSRFNWVWVLPMISEIFPLHSGTIAEKPSKKHLQKFIYGNWKDPSASSKIFGNNVFTSLTFTVQSYLVQGTSTLYTHEYFG